MQELVEVLLGERFLAFSNLLAVFFIAIHLTCEFAHYIHEFISSRKDAKRLDTNNGLLENLVVRVETLESTINNRKCHLVDKDKEDKR